MSSASGSPLSETNAVYARIACAIGERIATGQIKEGALLPKEVALQAEFGASRQAVREALKVLGAKRMISARKRAGTSVSPRSDWDLLDADVLSWHTPGSLPDTVLRDLVELRRVIEPLAATLAARRADAKALAKIGAALDDMRRGVADRTMFFKADIAFLRISFDLQMKVHEPLSQGYAAHAAVFHAIKSGDAVTASAAMNRLLDRASTELFRAKAPQGVVPGPDSGV